MSKTQIAILISVVVLSCGVVVYFNTHQKSFTPSNIHLASPSYQPTIKQVKLDSSNASELISPTVSAQKK